MAVDGLCECGCGQAPPIAAKTVSRLRWKKGEPRPFVPGHAGRKPVEIVEDPETGCWPWPLGKTSGGYGVLSVKRRLFLAHRAYYEDFIGPIPEGMQIDHLCRNRACVNPGHLEPVTCRENLMRGETRAAENARKTECINGHPFNEANTYWTAKGYRTCRICQRKRMRERAAA